MLRSKKAAALMIIGFFAIFIQRRIWRAVGLAAHSFFKDDIACLSSEAISIKTSKKQEG